MPQASSQNSTAPRTHAAVPRVMHGHEDRKAVKDCELEQEQGNAPEVSRVPDARAHAQCQPGQHDEQHHLERHEHQNAKVFAQQQLTAPDRLGEQYRRRGRFQERRHKSRRPHQGQQQPEGTGDAAGKNQLEKVDGAAPVSTDRNGHGSKGQRHPPTDRFHTIAQGLFRTGAARRRGLPVDWRRSGRGETGMRRQENNPARPLHGATRRP